MIRALVSGAPPTPQANPDDLWVSALKNRILPNWRTDEWVSEWWAFLGDPNNQMTATFLCSNDGCERHVSTGTGRMCNTCIVAQRDGMLQSRLEWQSEVGPGNYPRYPPRQPMTCRMERDGVKCVRRVHMDGLCITHRASWRNWLSRTGANESVREFHTFLREAAVKIHTVELSQCAVPACFRDVRPEHNLCKTHMDYYRVNSAPVEETEWAAKAVPLLGAGAFSLNALPDTARWELLYVLQCDDSNGYRIDPGLMSSVTLNAVKLLGGKDSFRSIDLAERVKDVLRSNLSAAAWANRASRYLETFAMETFQSDPTDGDVWDAASAGIVPSARSKNNPRMVDPRFARRKPLDFRSIRQEWLREAVKAYVRDLKPSLAEARLAIEESTRLSEVMCLRPNSDDRRTASIRDINAYRAALMVATNTKGVEYGPTHKSHKMNVLKNVIGYARGAGLLEDVPTGFGVFAQHRLRSLSGPNLAARDLPLQTVKQLRENLKTFTTCPPTGSLLSADDLTALYRTALLVLLDTGRRRGEVVSLRTGCVVTRQRDGQTTYTGSSQSRV